MSYARWSEGDVYVFQTRLDSGALAYICMCPEFQCDTRAQMLVHLRVHEALGDYVPARAFDQLTAEIAAGEP